VANFAVSTQFRGIDMMSNMFSKMGNNAKTTTNKISNMFSSLGSSIKKVGSVAGKFLAFAGLAGGLYLLQGAIRDTIRLGLSFEKTLMQASIRFGDLARPGSEAFKEIEKKAKEVGRTTEHTTSEAAEGMRLLAGAGFSVEQSLAGIGPLADTATAASIDLAKATDVSATSLSIFGMMTENSAQLQKNMARSSDVMLAAVNSAKMEVDDYLETMKVAGPVFHTAGRDMEEMAALTAIMARGAVKGSEAGTAMRNIFLNLQAPTDKQKKLLKQLGVEIDDGTGKMKPMNKIVQELTKSMEKYGPMQKAAALETLVGRKAVSKMMAVMEQGSDSIKELNDKLYDVTGTTKRFAEQMRDTTESRIAIMNSAIEALKLSIFEGLKPVIVDITERVQEMASGMSEYIETNPKAVKTITILAASFVGLTVAAGALAVIIGIVNVLMAANPAVWVVVGILAVIAVIAVMITWWEKVRIYVESVMLGIAIGAGIAAVAIGGILLPILAVASAIFLIYHNWEIITAYWGSALSKMWNGVVSFGEKVKDIFDDIMISVANVIEKITGWISDKIDKIIGKISGVVGKIGGFFGFGGTEENTPAQQQSIETPATASASVQREQIEQIITKTETQTSRLVIEDQTGRAKMKEPSGFYQLERTMQQ